jgi:nucleotide-binding universal stress UspA family protein
VLRSLLIGLDGSSDGEGALKLGLSWAKEHDALAVGVSVVDESGAVVSEQAAFASWFRRPIAEPLAYVARQRSRSILEKFEGRCQDLQVRCKAVNESGTPDALLLQEARWCDLVVLAQRKRSVFDSNDQASEMLARVLKDSPRPVIVVPRTPKDGEVVIIAYDGSLHATQALYAFEATGLARSRTVHVVSVDPIRSEAVRNVNRAVEFLRNHDVKAVDVAVETGENPVEAILREVLQRDAGLLVVGSCGQSMLREFSVGSVARSILEKSPVAVFCHH